MNTLDQEHIRTLRTAGYSYGQIANVLHMKKVTVKNHCLRHDIHPAVGTDSAAQQGIRYQLCPVCQQLFIVDSKHQRQFCSNKCRFQYWKQDRDYKAYLEAEAKYYRTLQKELDFLEEKSDELDGGTTFAPIGRRREET